MNSYDFELICLMLLWIDTGTKLGNTFPKTDPLVTYFYSHSDSFIVLPYFCSPALVFTELKFPLPIFGQGSFQFRRTNYKGMEKKCNELLH